MVSGSLQTCDMGHRGLAVGPRGSRRGLIAASVASWMQGRSNSKVLSVEGIIPGSQEANPADQAVREKNADGMIDPAFLELLRLSSLALKNLGEKLLATIFWCIVAPFAVFVFVAGIHYRVLPPLIPDVLFAILDPKIPYYTFFNAFCIMFGGLSCLTEFLDPKYDGHDRASPAQYAILLCLIADVYVLLSCVPGLVFWLAGILFWGSIIIGGIAFAGLRRMWLGSFS